MTYLPRHIVIAQACPPRTRVGELVSGSTRRVLSLSGQRHHLTVDETLVTVLVITHETVGTTKLEVGDGLAQRLPELLLADHISKTDRGEEAPAVTFGKLLRSIVAGIEL